MRSDELKIRMFAVPSALLVALLIHSFSAGQFLQRTFFSMWLHELGHAVAAWLTGRFAVPGPWFTPMADERSWVFAVLLSAGLAVAAWKISRAFLVVLAVQVVCTLLPPPAAEVFILFAGDGGAMVFGTALMLAMFVPPESRLHRLRWGLLVIGSAAFVDVFSVWWGARSDIDLIPFGHNEGMGLSDPSRLTEDHGWAVRSLVNRYVFLGAACLVVLTGVNVWDVRRR